VFVLRNSSPGGIINQLNFMDLHGLDDSYLSNYVKNVYGVTPEMVSQYTKNNLQYGKMIKVMVGDKEAIQQQITKQKAAPKSF
jgi:zinc protease